MKVEGISGVLLAGGRSRRMGQDKRGLTVGGRSLFERVLGVFEEIFDSILVVVAEHSRVTDGLSHRVVTDLIPGKGPIGGLYTGLSHASESSVFLAACDMPFLNIPLVMRICDFSRDTDITVVKLHSGIQPMHGVYSKKCLPVLKDLIEQEHLGMRELLAHGGLSTRIIQEESIKDLDTHFVSFMNVNTPSDLEMANKFCPA